MMLSFGFAFGSFVAFHLCFRFFTQMDPEVFWPHEGVLCMMKQEVVKRGWLSDAPSSEKLKGEWKKASTLGMLHGYTARLMLGNLPMSASPLFIARL